MPLGPIELLCVKFPGNQFTGEIIPALKELVDASTIRIIDVLFLQKDETGNVSMHELDALDDLAYDAFDPVVNEVSGFLSESDGLRLAAMLEPNSSAALMLFENTWATRFRDAILNAQGKVLLNERIPRSVIDTLVAEQLQATHA